LGETGSKSTGLLSAIHYDGGLYRKEGEILFRDALKSALRLVYAILRFRFPRTVSELNLKVRARNPKTFGEHLLYLMAYDRDPNRQLISDKLLVRDFIAHRVGSQYLPKLHAVANSGTELLKNSLPDECVLKVNHGSGGSIIRWNGAPSGAFLPEVNRWLGWKRFQVTPKNFNDGKAERLIDYWLRLDYSYWPGRLPEWNYQNIERRCFAEELLRNDQGTLPSDYRFYTFYGQTKAVGVDTPMPDGSKTVKHFIEDWTPITVNLKAGRKVLPEPNHDIPKPKQYEEMVFLAKKIAADFPWMRVDFYIVNEQIYVGELTNFPTAGQGKYSPVFFDEYLGTFFTEKK